MQANQLENTNRLLSTLLRLEKRLRSAESPTAIRFMAVNDTLALVGFDQGVFGSRRKGVQQLSGLSEPDLNAPYVGWLNKVIRYVDKHAELKYLTAEDLPKRLAAEWHEWLPANLAAISVAGEWLFLARAKPFSEPEKALLAEWAELLDFHLNIKKRPPRRLPAALDVLRSPILWVATFVAISFVIPVRLSVLAPAEVVAKNPALVRAPLDAVVAEVFVQPEQMVQQGELLFRFEERTLQNQLRVAQQRITTAEAAYRQAAQQALVDAAAQNRLVLLRADIEEAQIEVQYLSEKLARTEVRAPISGQVLMQNRQEWLGRPVALGERMLSLADPSAVEIRGWLAPSDQVPIQPGSAIKLFDESRPDLNIAGKLISVGYQIEERPDGSFAFPVRGEFDTASDLPPIGSRGTVRLEGEDVSLAYMIMRRPMALLRQWLGV